ncbi:DNA-binding MarR family transcriptional regulator [Streptacidiphilus sp. MAP12-16]
MNDQSSTDELRVLRVVVEFFRREGRGYYPNVGDIAQATGRSNEEVARLITSLEAQNLITAHHLKPGRYMITGVTPEGLESVNS